MLSSNVHPARRFFLLERVDYDFGHLKATLTPLRSRACRGKKRSCWISTSVLVVSNSSCLSNRRNTVATANRSSAFARLEHVSISGSLINLLHILHPYTLPGSFCKRDEISIKGWWPFRPLLKPTLRLKFLRLWEDSFVLMNKDWCHADRSLESKFRYQRSRSRKRKRSYTSRYLPVMEFHNLGRMRALKTSAEAVGQSILC
jgi:hypothetical protein